MFVIMPVNHVLNDIAPEASRSCIRARLIVKWGGLACRAHDARRGRDHSFSLGSQLTTVTPPTGILETILYASDLDAAEKFYRDVLWLEPVSKMAGRQVFYRVGNQMLLIFNPEHTVLPPKDPKLPVPPHGMTGEGSRVFCARARTRSPSGARISKTKVSPSKPISNGRAAGARSISAIPLATPSSSQSRAFGD